MKSGFICDFLIVSKITEKGSMNTTETCCSSNCRGVGLGEDFAERLEDGTIAKVQRLARWIMQGCTARDEMAIARKLWLCSIQTWDQD